MNRLAVQTLLRALLEVYAPSSPLRPSSLGLLPHLLKAARSTPSPSLAPDSPAHGAFDPAISRKLVAHVPLSTVDLGSDWQADAWERMAELVAGLEEVADAIWDNGHGGGGWRNVVGWLDYFHLLGVTPARSQSSAFIRSLMLVRSLSPQLSTRFSPLPYPGANPLPLQSIFYQPDENTIFNFAKLGHLSSLFFAEVAGVPSGVLRELVELAEEDRPMRGDGWDGRKLSEAVNIFCQRVDGVCPVCFSTLTRCPR